MLKISTILPLTSLERINLTDISGNYLSRVKSDTNPADRLRECLRHGQISINEELSINPLSGPQIELINYILDNFDSIVTGTPEVLSQHINSINDTLLGSESTTPFGLTYSSTLFGKAMYEIFGYDRYFRTKARKGLWLAEQLNIKTCPYCNSQYTIVIKDSSSVVAKFQFDHFYSKRRFPYLSLSLFNLIPSCALCNIIKGDRIMNLKDHYNPYHTNLSSLAEFRAEYDVDVKKISIGDIEGLKPKIRFKSKFPEFDSFVDRHNKLYQIESCYNRFHDIVEDLLSKSILYNSSFKNDIMKINGLFDKSTSLYYRYLIGNYGLTEEILERPLSKLTQDIAKQFEIIK